MIAGQRNLAVFFGVVVTLGGAVMLGGWLFGIESLVHPHGKIIPIKPITAATFIVAGIQLVLTGWFFDNPRKQAIMPIIVSAALFQFIVMGSQMLMNLTGSMNGIEFHIESPTFSYAEFNLDAMPASVGTILTFFCISMVGILDNFGDRLMLRRLVNGAAVAIAVSAFAGYVLNVPVLYFNMPGVSSPMAIYTAALGLFAGISIWFSSPISPLPEED